MLLAVVAGRARGGRGEARPRLPQRPGRDLPAPFAKAGQYPRLGARVPAGGDRPEEAAVRGRLRGLGRVPAADRRGGPPRGHAALGLAPPAPPGSEPEPGWKSFAFDVRDSVFAEPGPDGVPRFRVDVDEVKRRELEGVAGALARVLGRHFDGIITQVADGRASTLNAKLNEKLRAKVAAFKEYGVLREIAYSPESVTLTFDVTRYKSEGIAGYVYSTPRRARWPFTAGSAPGSTTASTRPAPRPPPGTRIRLRVDLLLRPADPRADTVPLHRSHGASGTTRPRSTPPSSPALATAPRRSPATSSPCRRPARPALPVRRPPHRGPFLHDPPARGVRRVGELLDLQEHLDHFGQVAVQLVERFALGVGAGKPGT